MYICVNIFEAFNTFNNKGSIVLSMILFYIQLPPVSAAYCFPFLFTEISRFIPRILCTFCLASAACTERRSCKFTPFHIHSFLKLPLTLSLSQILDSDLLSCIVYFFFLPSPSLCNPDGIYLEQFNHHPQSKLSTIATNNQFISMSAQTEFIPFESGHK